MLVSISTPYRKTGLVYQKWHEHFAADDDAVLVVRGPSRQFNPLLTEQSVQQALKDDPEGARAEWEAEFRSDLATFLDEQPDRVSHRLQSSARTPTALLQIYRLRRSFRRATRCLYPRASDTRKVTASSATCCAMQNLRSIRPR